MQPSITTCRLYWTKNRHTLWKAERNSVSTPARLQGHTREMQDEQGKSGTNRGISRDQPIKRRCKKPIKRTDFITLPVIKERQCVPAKC